MILLDYPCNFIKFILASLSVFFCEVHFWKITETACRVKWEASEFEACHTEQRLLQLHQQNHCLWMFSCELHGGVPVWAGRCTASPKSAVNFLGDIFFPLKVKNPVFSQVSPVSWQTSNISHIHVVILFLLLWTRLLSDLCKNCNSHYCYWLGCWASLVLGIIQASKILKEVTLAHKALIWPLLSWVHDPSANIIKWASWTRIPGESGQGLPSNSPPVVQHVWWGSGKRLTRRRRLNLPSTLLGLNTNACA